jgi:hypothetical protein
MLRPGDRGLEIGDCRVGTHVHTHTHTHTCLYTHVHTETGLGLLGSVDVQGCRPCPSCLGSPAPTLTPSPAWAGPGFGAGGRGWDLQGSGSLSDEGTPTEETGQGSRQSASLEPVWGPPSPTVPRHPPHFLRSDTDCATSSYIWAS